MKPIIDLYHWQGIMTQTIELLARFVGVKLRKHELSSKQFTEMHMITNFLANDQLVPWIEDKGIKISNSISDTNVIYAYLVDHYMPKEQLFYPRDPQRRAYMNEFLKFQVIISHGSIAYAPKMFSPDRPLVQEGIDNLQRCLACLDHTLRVMGFKFALCNELTIVDISMRVTLCHVECYGFDISNYKNLTRYYDDLKKEIPDFDNIRRSISEITQLPMELATRYSIDDHYGMLEKMYSMYLRTMNLI